MKKKLLIVVGTRPEAIKMAPVYSALAAEPSFVVKTLNSGQHQELLDQVFEAFEWKPDYTLSLNRVSHDAPELYALLFQKLDCALRDIKPDCVIVHGDTATAG